MNRSEIFMLLINEKPWTDYEWAKRSKITRATIGNNRTNRGIKIKANTLEAMAKACGKELRHTNSDDGVGPNGKEARFELIEISNEVKILQERIKELEKENKLLRGLISIDG